MRSLVACPFCREMYPPKEASACPDCDVALVPLAKLPLSHDAEAVDPDEAEAPLEPHMETLPWTYHQRGRGLLVGFALAGLTLFFTPWVAERAPELRTLSGYELARMLGWMWAPAVAWFVMLPLVLTRRSIYRMRGARVAVAFLACIVLATVVVRVVFAPESTALRPVRIEWAWGLWATAALAISTAVASFGFGGRLDDVPTKTIKREGNETLH